jgi:hypothetical protein
MTLMVVLLAAGPILAVALAVVIHDFFEGETLIADLADEFQLARLSLAELDEAWANKPNRTEAVVSLTTIPSRLPLIAPTIKSLMRQSVAPSRIILNLPTVSLREGSPYVLPEFLKGLRAVEINSCPDLGPATKLLPSLRRLPPSLPILVVDDDRIYHRSVLADLLEARQARPGVAFGLSGWRVPGDLTDRATTVWSNLMMHPPAPLRARRLRQATQVDILQGFSGYLVLPDQFDLAAVADLESAPAAARTVDDVWFAAHCRVPRYVCPAARANYQAKLQRRQYRRTSLGLINRGPGGDQNRNNSIVIRHFSDRWLCRTNAGSGLSV